MDSNTGGILGIFAFLTSAAGLIYTAINHKRIRCRCCGKNLDMSVDVDPTDAKPSALQDKGKYKPGQTLPETASTIEILPRDDILTKSKELPKYEIITKYEEDVPKSEDEEAPKVVLPPRRAHRIPKITPYQ
jgi:hypothetical protein